MEKEKDVIEINVVDLCLYMLRRWWVYLLVMMGTLAVGLAICLLMITPKYESTTKVFILTQQNNGSLAYSDMQISGQLTKNYEQLIVTRDVLETVIRKCALEDEYEELLDRVTVENITDTYIISITVEDPSPAKAQEIANCIRDTAADHIKNVTDVEAVNMAETANLPKEPSSPSVKLWALLSAAAGFMIVFITHIILFLSDDTIKSEADIQKYLGLPTLVAIPKADMELPGKFLGRQDGSSRENITGAHKTGVHAPATSTKRR